MTIHALDKVVAALLILFGLWLVYTGFGYGVMQGTTPGAGLFPIIMGTAIAILSTVNLARALAGIEVLPAGMSRRELVKAAGVVLTLIVSILLTPFIGMTIAVMLAMAAIGLILRPEPQPTFLIRLGLVSILSPIACFLLFDWLLGIPIPSGPFGF
jgi:putative tricarboxylic transport membrane protein